VQQEVIMAHPEQQPVRYVRRDNILMLQVQLHVYRARREVIMARQGRQYVHYVRRVNTLM